jgi:cephalosporin-C deacetylase
MAYTDNYLQELQSYQPELTRREDFDAFWQETRKQADSVPLDPSLKPYDYPSPYARVYDIAYNGFDSTRIHGWYIVPTIAGSGKLPCLVHYHGFTGDRGKPADYMQWLMMGIAVVAVDCRAQCGATGNSAKYTSGNTQSVACYGIMDKNEYYYRAVYMDCIKALDFACAQPEVDKARLIIEGGSQGGALTMAVCSLDSRPWLALADVPSNSDITRRVEGAYGSFAAVTDYLKFYPMHTEKAFETLSYFDTMNMAHRIGCKVLASVGLKDATCPARQFFATYNRITTAKQVCLYPFNGHEGGGGVHNEIKLRFVRDNLAGAAGC